MGFVLWLAAALAGFLAGIGETTIYLGLLFVLGVGSINAFYQFRNGKIVGFTILTIPLFCIGPFLNSAFFYFIGKIFI